MSLRRSPRLAARAAVPPAAPVVLPVPPPPLAIVPVPVIAIPPPVLVVGPPAPNQPNLPNPLAAPIPHINELMVADEFARMQLHRDFIERALVSDRGLIGVWMRKAQLQMRRVYDPASSPAVMMVAAGCLRTTLDGAQRWGEGLKVFANISLKKVGIAKAALMRLSGNASPNLVFTAQRTLLECRLDDFFWPPLLLKADQIDAANRPLYQDCLLDAMSAPVDFYIMQQPGQGAANPPQPVAQPVAPAAPLAQPRVHQPPAAQLPIAPPPAAQLPIPPPAAQVPLPPPGPAAGSAPVPGPPPPPAGRQRRQSSLSFTGSSGSDSESDDDNDQGAGGIVLTAPNQVVPPVASVVPAPIGLPASSVAQVQQTAPGVQGLRLRDLRSKSPSTARSASPVSMTGSSTSEGSDGDDQDQDGAGVLVAGQQMQGGGALESESTSSGTEVIEASRTTTSNDGRGNSEQLDDLDPSWMDNVVLDGDLDVWAARTTGGASSWGTYGTPVAHLYDVRCAAGNVSGSAESPLHTAVGVSEAEGSIDNVDAIRPLSHHPVVPESNESRAVVSDDADDTLEGVPSILTGSMSSVNADTSLADDTGRAGDTSDSTSTPHISYLLRDTSSHRLNVRNADDLSCQTAVELNGSGSESRDEVMDVLGGVDEDEEGEDDEEDESEGVTLTPGLESGSWDYVPSSCDVPVRVRPLVSESSESQAQPSEESSRLTRNTWRDLSSRLSDRILSPFRAVVTASWASVHSTSTAELPSTVTADEISLTASTARSISGEAENSTNTAQSFGVLSTITAELPSPNAVSSLSASTASLAAFTPPTVSSTSTANEIVEQTEVVTADEISVQRSSSTSTARLPSSRSGSQDTRRDSSPSMHSRKRLSSSKSVESTGEPEEKRSRQERGTKRRSSERSGGSEGEPDEKRKNE